MKPIGNLIVNHIDRVGLNCTRSNLEICTQSINSRKSKKRIIDEESNYSSQHRGVYFFPERGKYVARITINYKTKHLGIFSTEKEAAEAYNIAVKTLIGEDYPLNDI